MNERKVSIIVPVYKVEKYLEECIESLRKQSYQNLEIVLIDDESTDNCPEICDAFVMKDERIKVIHKKNGGAASARNAGLDVVIGDYVGFVDSDDYVKESYIYELVRDLEESDADISACSYINIYKDREEVILMEKEGVYTNVEYLERFLWDWKCGLLWNKLFKKELFDDVRFSEGHVIDDEFFTYKAVLNAKKVCVKNMPLYCYRMRKSGAMNQGREKQMLLDRMEYLPERFELVTERYPELYSKYLENLADNLIRFKREAVAFNKVYELVKKIQKKYLLQVLLGDISYKMKYSYIHSWLSKEFSIAEKRQSIDTRKYFD